MDGWEVLRLEVETLRGELAEAREALEAIRSGAVDALVIYTSGGEQVFTLQGAEHPYRVMVETMNEGAATISDEGIVLWANAWLANLLQTPLSSILGNPLTLWIAPKDRPVYEAILAQGQQEKCKAELDFRASQGQPIPVLLSLGPVRSLDMGHVCLIVTDLTEQKQQAQVAAAERMAKAIIEQAGEAIVVCDSQGRVTRASQTAQRLAEVNPLFQPFESVFPLCFDPPAPSDGSPLNHALAGQSFQGLEASLEQTVPGGGGKKRVSLQVSLAPLTVPGEGQIGAVITMADITERKAADAAIRTYANQLERSNRDLQDFAFIASHDMQEPLRKVEAFGDLLIQKYEAQLDDVGRDYIERMQAAAARMKKMIQDLLNYSRVSTKSFPFTQVDLNQTGREVISDLEAHLLRTQGEIELGDLPVIEADALQMAQLLQNLFSNALKFHAPGVRPIVRVQARAIAGGEQIELSIEDNGIGFDLHHLERIFQPFQRLHGRGEYDGNGIGLALCRKIVERHHGRITAHSAPGQGATFIVTLPLKQPPE